MRDTCRTTRLFVAVVAGLVLSAASGARADAAKRYRVAFVADPGGVEAAIMQQNVSGLRRAARDLAVDVQIVVQPIRTSWTSPLGFDSGRLTLAAAEKQYLVRNGQRIAVYLAVETLTGKRGAFDLRWRVEFVGAGEGSTVGTGTWSLVRGTGMYAGVTGGGRLAAVVMTPRGVTSAQFEGLLRAPPN